MVYRPITLLVLWKRYNQGEYDGFPVNLYDIRLLVYFFSACGRRYL
jgi:hypothetical protein